jgi:hypothetical protein
MKRCVGWVGGVLLGCLLGAGVARAVAPPDSAELASLRDACDAAWRVRVTAARGTFEMSHPALDEAGLSSRTTGRPALVMGRGAATSARLVPWADVERIDAEMPMAGRRALIGLALGLGVGASMLLAWGPDLAESGDHGVLGLAVVTTVAGTAGGWLAGSLAPERRRILP